MVDFVDILGVWKKNSLSVSKKLLEVSFHCCEINFKMKCFKILTREFLFVTDGSLVSSFLKVCFSCGEDPSQVPEGNLGHFNCLSFIFPRHCWPCWVEPIFLLVLKLKVFSKCTHFPSGGVMRIGNPIIKYDYS